MSQPLDRGLLACLPSSAADWSSLADGLMAAAESLGVPDVWAAADSWVWAIPGLMHASTSRVPRIAGAMNRFVLIILELLRTVHFICFT